MSLYIAGAVAALITSALWTVNAVLFTSAGRRIGAISVNAWRIVFASLLLWVAHIVLLGSPVPAITADQWFWIGLSGVVGLCIGDFGLFASFVIIGTRRAVLVMSLSAIFAAFAALLLFGETLDMLAVGGMALTLTGVAVVILEDETRSDEKRLKPGEKLRGTMLAFVGAGGQGIGIAFLKKGMLLFPAGGGLDAAVSLAVVSTLVRMLLGAVAVWLVIAAWGKLPEIRRALRDRRGMRFVTLGAFIGPFLGVTLSTLAAYLIPVGIAQTLISLMPVMVIPVVWLVYRQRTSWRGIIGAIIAVAGVALLFLVG